MPHTALYTCSLCEAMCGIEVQVDGDRITSIQGDPDDPFSRGHICPKAVALADLQHDPDRLRHPIKRTPGGWEPVGWDEALDDIAARIHRLQQEHGPDSVASYLGNPNVHNLGSMLFIPELLRTIRSRNRFSATSLDQLPHMLAAYLMFGHELLMPVPDLDRSDLVVILGGNPIVSGGSIMTAGGVRRRLDAVRRRGQVVVIDPRRTETARRADAHHFIRPGTDVWLLLGLLRCSLEVGPPLLGHLAEHVDGLELVSAIAGRVELAEVARRTGLEPSVIQQLAIALRDTERAVLYGRLGACAQRHGGVAGWLLNVVNAVTGNLDQHGGLMVTLPAFDPLSPWGRRPKVRERFGRWHSRVRSLPELAGELPVSVLPEEIETPGPGQIQGLLVWAGNPVLTSSGGGRLDALLGQLRLCVAVDLYLNETARHAHYVLPAVPPLSRDHYDVAFNLLAVRDTARFAPAVLPADGQTRHDWQIALDLTDRLLQARGGGLRQRARLAVLRRLGPTRLLAAGLRAGPRGLRRGAAGISLRRLRAQPHGLDLGPLQPRLLARSPRERLQLAPEIFVAETERILADRGPSPEGLLLIGRRTLRSANSWLHNSPRMVKGPPRCTLLVHPQDAQAHGLVSAGRARVRSRVGEIEVVVRVSDEIMPGVVSLPHGWGHGREGVGWQIASAQPGASVNDLTDPQAIDPLSGNAVLNGVPVTLSPVDPPVEARAEDPPASEPAGGHG
ncbi:MAG TPA: molybdopterin oxidoreductase family protein [Deltaproteobacteria bacterium]|nr:molybdopterin oxidoreductase family protein [Deltaproteobacteria bacterium]